MATAYKHVVMVVVLACCVTGFSACGGDEDSTSSSNGAKSGVASPRSRPFVKYSGTGPAKLHLAEFGTEGSAGDRAEVETILSAYLKAIRAGRWQSACGLLSAALSVHIDEIAEQAKRQPQPTCVEILPALVQSSNTESGQSIVSAPHDIASLRIKEGPGGGFALFHGGDGKDYWMTVNRDGGRWGILSPVPEAFAAQR